MTYKTFISGLCIIFIAFPAYSQSKITGTIKFEGEAPVMKPLNMSKEPACLKMHDTPPVEETFVLGKGKTLANILIRVKSGLKKTSYPTPAEPVILDQNGCIYKPHVLAAMVNQEIKILNSDGMLHNVHFMPKVNTEINLAMPKFRKSAIKKLGKEEYIIPIKCDVHPWMGAWVAVLTHPFFSVTEKDGKYTISGLEAGTYEIEAWHEAMGTQTASVTIGADETKTVDFTFKR